MLCRLAAEHHAWAQWEASASAINPLSLGTTKADREIGKLRLDPAFPWSSQVAEHLLSGVDSSSQCTIALNLKTRFFYSFKTVTNGYKPITGQLTGSQTSCNQYRQDSHWSRDAGRAGPGRMKKKLSFVWPRSLDAVMHSPPAHCTQM